MAVGVAMLCIATGATLLHKGVLDPFFGRTEGQVTIYGSVEAPKIVPLLAAFRRRYPGIDAHYQRRDSAGTYRQFVADAAAGHPVADLVWNSSMSAQVKLINDGYSQPYLAKAKPMMPRWSIWKDEGYGVTSEALVYAYNRDAMVGIDVPRSHRELLALLETRPKALVSRIGLLDFERNEIAFMGYSQDLIASADSSRLYQAIAALQPQIFESNRQLYDALAAGRISLAYNLLGSYPLDEAAPQVQVILPRDYLLTTSRIAFIPRHAPHPVAARVFLEFLLSREGQQVIADEHLGAIRTDVDDHTFHGEQPRPIRVGPSLLADFDQMRRRRLLCDWARWQAGATQDIQHC